MSFAALRDLLDAAFDDARGSAPGPPTPRVGGRAPPFSASGGRRRGRGRRRSAPAPRAGRAAARGRRRRPVARCHVRGSTRVCGATPGRVAHWVLVARRANGKAGAPLALDRVLDERLTTISIGPLSLGALHRPLRDRLGVTPPPRPQLCRIHESSGGNPFFIWTFPPAGAHLFTVAQTVHSEGHAQLRHRFRPRLRQADLRSTLAGGAGYYPRYRTGTRRFCGASPRRLPRGVSTCSTSAADSSLTWLACSGRTTAAWPTSTTAVSPVCANGPRRVSVECRPGRSARRATLRRDLLLGSDRAPARARAHPTTAAAVSAASRRSASLFDSQPLSTAQHRVPGGWPDDLRSLRPAGSTRIRSPADTPWSTSPGSLGARASANTRSSCASSHTSRMGEWTASCTRSAVRCAVSPATAVISLWLPRHLTTVM